MDIATLSGDLRKSRKNTATKYREALSDSSSRGREYLAGRGLSEATIRRFGLGIVDDPEPGDEWFSGHLAIPYLTWCPVRGTTVSTIRYRSLDPEETPKYKSYKGEKDRLFNVRDLLLDTRFICICEGEIDTMSASQCGLPTIGISGAQKWKPHMARLFRGYQKIYVLQDDDKAGNDFTDSIAKSLGPVTAIRMNGGDVNSVLVENGEEAIREMVGENV